MKIYLFLSLILLPITVLGQSSAKTPKPTPTPNRKSVDVQRVELDKIQIALPCRPGGRSRSGSCNDDDMLVNVRTSVSTKDAKDLKYKYTVTGGFIRGTGANVRWDLWDLRPGTFELTVAVDDGCGFCGASKIATVTISECPDCLRDCFCPTITVSGPANDVAAGESMYFTANVSGGSQNSITYNWTISGGNITNGQGTPSIEVSTTPGIAGTKITATVKIGGLEESCNCDPSASATASVRSHQ